MKSETSEKVRHIVLRADVGDVLPDALVRALREKRVAGGWLRGSGVLSEIELRAYGSDIGGHGVSRRIAGPAQVLMLDGSVGVADGDVSLGLRGVFARETDRGLETVAGEITAARVVALEVFVVALEDVVMPRGLDPDAGVWLLSDPTGAVTLGTATPDTPRTVPSYDRATPAAPTSRTPSPAWSEAITASALAPKERQGHPVKPLHAIPIRPGRSQEGNEDGLFPEPGDYVEHFAFGTCEVLKSDGDRLHLKVGKDGRIREIALEMLRVTLLTSDGDKQRYRLDRKL